MKSLLGSVQMAHFSAVSNGSAPHKSWLLPWGQPGAVVMPLNWGWSSPGAVCALRTNVRVELEARPEVEWMQPLALRCRSWAGLRCPGRALMLHTSPVEARRFSDPSSGSMPGKAMHRTPSLSSPLSPPLSLPPGSRLGWALRIRTGVHGDLWSRLAQGMSGPELLSLQNNQRESHGY